MRTKLKILFSLLAAIIIILGFTVPLNMTSGWYQQFMPNLNGAQISEITFVDSLTGFATTLYRNTNDTAYILRTSNSGDNWNISTSFNYPFYKIQFANQNTGIALTFQKLFKTTDKGMSWQTINIPTNAFEGMHVLNQDTIWLVSSNSAVGGVFRTNNGGANWIPQGSFSPNPARIYMYNRDTGFISDNAGDYLRKTTNSGNSWTLISGQPGFTDMYFINSLTGWRAYGSMRKTTDGGLNWTTQTLPTSTYMVNNQILKFSNIGNDTIWGVGGDVFYPGLGSRGILYRTTNGGTNWLFQIPDSINFTINRYFFVKFINNKTGWAYHPLSGIHTTSGGDPIWYTGKEQINSSIPNQYKLYQNFPNPFNPTTKIKFDVPTEVKGQKSEVRLVIYDILGKEIAVLVNELSNPGTYEIEWNAANYPSGIYYYKITAGDYSETKKMILIK